MPLIWLMVLHTNRKDLSLVTLRKKWGILFFRYKEDYYFWEILIAYRKLLIIFVSVYLTDFGVIVQALILFLILLIFTFLTLRLKPFDRRAF